MTVEVEKKEMCEFSKKKKSKVLKLNKMNDKNFSLENLKNQSFIHLNRYKVPIISHWACL